MAEESILEQTCEKGIADGYLAETREKGEKKQNSEL